jgi:hypothetical protein
MPTVSIEACKKLRASRPTQTLSMEKSPPRIIEEPLCAPSCLRIGSALVLRQLCKFEPKWLDSPSEQVEVRLKASANTFQQKDTENNVDEVSFETYVMCSNHG